MVHQPDNLNRRLERHHRIDGDLQARARPASLVRKDESANEIVQKIRGFVERNADENQSLHRRLGLFGSGTQRGSGDSPSSGSSSSDDPSSDPSSSSADSGSSDTTGSGNNGDSGSDTTTTAAAAGRPGGFPQTTREDRTTSTREIRTTSSTSSTSSTPTTSSTSTRSSTTRATTTSTPKSSSTLMPSTSYAYVTSSPLPTLNNAAAATSSPSETASSGVGVGPIIGIVAGALAGVAVLAVIIGFLFKKFGRKDDPYEADPFDRNSFRRQSAMLPDNFDDDDHMPEMSEAHNGPFADDHGYMADAAMGAGAMGGAGYAAAHNEGGPRPPTMFANHMNAPAAQMSMHDAPAVPAIGAIYTAGHDPSPQLPPMAFGGSDPYSIAGVGRQRMENNINNPYGYLDRQYSASRSSPHGKDQMMHQDYADLDRNGSQGSNGYEQQQFRHQYEEQYSNYEHHNTAGRPGTSEGRSGTPDLPNVQQTYAMAGDDTAEMQRQERVMSPHRNVASPQHMSQELISNANARSNGSDSQGYRSAHSNSPDQPHQPLQVRNLLPNPSQQQRPISAVSSVVDDDAAYGGVW